MIQSYWDQTWVWHRMPKAMDDYQDSTNWHKLARLLQLSACNFRWRRVCHSQQATCHGWHMLTHHSRSHRRLMSLLNGANGFKRTLRRVTLATSATLTSVDSPSSYSSTCPQNCECTGRLSPQLPVLVYKRLAFLRQWKCAVKLSTWVVLKEALTDARPTTRSRKPKKPALKSRGKRSNRPSNRACKTTQNLSRSLQRRVNLTKKCMNFRRLHRPPAFR